MTETKRSLRRRLALPTLLVALLGYLGWASIWIVEQNESGLQVRLGRVVRTLPAGIHFTMPWPVTDVRTIATTEVRTMPVGFTLIDKMKGLGPRDEEVQWLTGDTNIVELQATVTYTITSPKDYLYGISEMSDGSSRGFTIRKVTEAVLTKLIATMPIDHVLSTGKTELQRRASSEVQEQLDLLGLGVLLTNFNIVQVAPPMSVIASFNDVASAKADRERMITEAAGDAERSMPRARSEANDAIQSARIYKNELVSEARGAATSFAKLAEQAAAEPQIARGRIWLDTLRRVFARVNTVVVPGGTPEKPTKVVLRN